MPNIHKKVFCARYYINYITTLHNLNLFGFKPYEKQQLSDIIIMKAQFPWSWLKAPQTGTARTLAWIACIHSHTYINIVTTRWCGAPAQLLFFSACWIFLCFRNPLNLNMDYRIFIMRAWPFLCVRVHPIMSRSPTPRKGLHWRFFHGWPQVVELSSMQYNLYKYIIIIFRRLWFFLSSQWSYLQAPACCFFCCLRLNAHCPSPDFSTTSSFPPDRNGADIFRPT